MGVLVAYLDLLTTPSKAQFANGLATALCRDLVGLKDRAIRKVTDFFACRSLQPWFGTSPDYDYHDEDYGSRFTHLTGLMP